jgi:ABC-type dipeptide/oligopeptide/nickel transport system permease component
LLLVSAIVFSLTRLILGDVVVLMFEERAYAEDLQALRAKLGLNWRILLPIR